MRRKAGFTLTEVLISLALLLVFFDLAGELFNRTLHTSWASQKAENQASSVDAAVARMRGDVWRANRIDVSDARSARLTFGDGSSALWETAADGSVQRTAGDGRERWDVSPADWTLAGGRATLTVVAREKAGTREMPLASQVVLARMEGP
jgi:prepilin-type N-terminal cleavage/methylation domain-containing protein